MLLGKRGKRMEDKFLCVMAGYDEATECYLAGIQATL